MEIKASSTFDSATLTEFNISHFFKKCPKKEIFGYALSLTISALFIALICVFLPEDSILNVLYYILRIFSAICALALAVSIFALYTAKKAYSRAGKMKDVKNEYVFSDNGIQETSIGNGFESKTAFAYTDIIKVVETKNFFFLYISKQQAYIIDKQTLIGGTAEELKMKLLAY